MLIAFGNCWSCGRRFTFDPDLVPSIPVDPQTKMPLDVEPSPDGLEVARARAVRQPVCEECVERANQARATDGREPIHVLPGAYL